MKRGVIYLKYQYDKRGEIVSHRRWMRNTSIPWVGPVFLDIALSQLVFLLEGELVRFPLPSPTEFPNFSLEEKRVWNTNQSLTLINLLTQPAANRCCWQKSKARECQDTLYSIILFDNIFSECKTYSSHSTKLMKIAKLKSSLSQVFVWSERSK